MHHSYHSRRCRRRDKLFQIVNIHGWFKGCESGAVESSDDEQGIVAQQAYGPNPAQSSEQARRAAAGQSALTLSSQPPESSRGEAHIARLNYPIEGPQEMRAGPDVGMQEAPEHPYHSPFTHMIDLRRTHHRRNSSHDSHLPESNSFAHTPESHEPSEEEQIKLAVALSLSDKSRHSFEDDFRENMQLAEATQASLQPVSSSGAAESLSWSLFINTCLGWDDTVVDGLYDVVGQFPEILEIAPDSGVTKQFPSLEELKRVPYTKGDAREVIVIDRDKDPVLCTIEWKAADAVAQLQRPGPRAQAQAILDVVIESMGGQTPREHLKQICWEETQHLKARALLFKTLADARSLSCKMLRGEHLKEGATVLLRLHGDVYNVDLFTGELTLLPNLGTSPQNKDISARASATETQGLDWQSDGNEEAELMPIDSGLLRETKKQSLAGGKSASQQAHILTNGRLTPDADGSSRDGGHANGSGHPGESGLAAGNRLNGFESSTRVSNPSEEGMPGAVGARSLRHDQASPEPHISSGEQHDAKENESSELVGNMDSPFLAIAEQESSETIREEGEGTPLSGSFEMVNRQDGDHAHILPVRTDPVWRNVSLPPGIRTMESQGTGTPLRTDIAATTLAASPSVATPSSRERDSNEGPQQSPASKLSQQGAKVHWKLKKLADLRPYSESAIHLYDPPRPQLREETALQERLETLHELQELQDLNRVQQDRANSLMSQASRGSSSHNRTAGQPPTEAPRSAQPVANVQSLPQLQKDTSGALEPADLADDFEISMDDIKKGPRIGHGSFGVVYKGTWLGTDVAIKELIVQDIYSDSDLKEEFERETSIMKRLRHVNVLLFLGVVTIPPNLAIVTQYMRRGSLYRILHKSDLALDSSRKRRMALDVARGMTYLHNCRPPIVHRDLKSDNLLVDYDFTVKVSDFGLSRVRRCTLLSGRSQAGTPHWTAPEVLRGQAYDESSDVYSFGVVLWELLTRKPPWEEKTEIQVIGAVGFGHARLQLPKGTNVDLAAAINSCWDAPVHRPSFKTMLETLKELSPDAFDQQTDS